jgi:hypothetical protein
MVSRAGAKIDSLSRQDYFAVAYYIGLFENSEETLLELRLARNAIS